MSKIGVFQQCNHRADVVGQHVISVAQVADDLTGSFCQCSVAVLFSSARMFGKVKEPDPLVLSFEISHNIPRGRRQPVTDNKDLYVRFRLGKNAADRKG